MLKRIVTKEDFFVLYKNFEGIYENNSPPEHYGGVPFDPKSIYSAWNNENSLVNQCVIVANFIDKDTIDAVSWFIIGQDFRVNKRVAQSYFWISKEKKSGILCLKKAIEICKNKKSDYIVLGILESSENKSAIANYYNKLGFKKDDESFFLQV